MIENVKKNNFDKIILTILVLIFISMIFSIGYSMYNVFYTNDYSYLCNCSCPPEQPKQLSQSLNEDAGANTSCIQSKEVCDGLDNDCDGIVDNSLLVDGEICGSDECGEMVEICNSGTLTCESVCSK